MSFARGPAKASRSALLFWPMKMYAKFSIAIVLASALITLARDAQAFRQPLTPAAAIETVRFMTSSDDRTPGNPDGVVSISPNGRRFIVRLVRGDVAANGVWMELLAGRIEASNALECCEKVARFFTSGLGSGEGLMGPYQDTVSDDNPVQWLNDESVAFLWSNADGVRQVVRTNIRTREVEFLTRHPTHVIAFAADSKGRIFYNAKARWSNSDAYAKALTDGFVVEDHMDAYSLFQRRLDDGKFYDQVWGTEFFVQEPSGEAREIELLGREVTSEFRHRIVISPDGRKLLINTTPLIVPAAWDRYTQPHMRRWIAQARRDPSNGLARNAHQLFVVNLEDGATRPLWDAVSLAHLTHAAWSPDARYVLLAPAYLPPTQSDEAGLNGRAAAIVDVMTREFEQLPVELWELRPTRVTWLNRDEVEIVQADGAALRSYRFKRLNGRWERSLDVGFTGLTFALRQNLNTPPRLFAIHGATEQLLIDPNPDLLAKFELGRVERLSGQLDAEVSWIALLYYPVRYINGERYPLIIQATYGPPNQEEFSLYGVRVTGLGPTSIAPYAAQVFANRNMAVLHLQVRGGAKFRTHEEAASYARAYEVLAEKMIRRGIADRRKIGIVGFSRNGYHVQYALTHSNFPYAAAVAADNWDPSYFQQTMTGYGVDAIAVNGDVPFEEGLKMWLHSAPGFNADRIRIPLRLVEQSNGLFGVLDSWEIFARLRYLKRPVEFFVIPDFERGAHTPQNPKQILAVQESTVDWFDFWLNGREDPDPAKAAQYERWRKLAKLQQADRGRSH